MFESGLPVDLNPALLAASERAFGIIRAAAERLAALSPPGTPRPPALMMALHIWSMSHGVASLFARGDAARRKLPMSAEDLLEAEVLIYLRGLGFPTDRRPRAKKTRRTKSRPGRRLCRRPAPGAPQNKFAGAAGARLDKNPGWFTYVNVIYIHNGVMPSWRGKWPTPQMSIAGAVPLKSPTTAPHMLDSPWHPGWIAVTVLGFIIWWPIGLALLFFTLGSRKMGCWSHGDRWSNKMERMQYKMERMKNRMERRGFPFGPPSSGNRAFDEYRMETLRRLEEEQTEFKEFLDRLRHAKDKEEFDQFMAQHRPRPTPPQDGQPQA